MSCLPDPGERVRPAGRARTGPGQVAPGWAAPRRMVAERSVAERSVPDPSRQRRLGSARGAQGPGSRPAKARRLMEQAWRLRQPPVRAVRGATVSTPGAGSQVPPEGAAGRWPKAVGPCLVAGRWPKAVGPCLVAGRRPKAVGPCLVAGRRTHAGGSRAGWGGAGSARWAATWRPPVHRLTPHRAVGPVRVAWHPEARGPGTWGQARRRAASRRAASRRAAARARPPVGLDQPPWHSSEVPAAVPADHRTAAERRAPGRVRGERSRPWLPLVRRSPWQRYGGPPSHAANRRAPAPSGCRQLHRCRDGEDRAAAVAAPSAPRRAAGPRWAGRPRCRRRRRRRRVPSGWRRDRARSARPPARLAR
jgi:hypothetical protein